MFNEIKTTFYKIHNILPSLLSDIKKFVFSKLEKKFMVVLNFYIFLQNVTHNTSRNWAQYKR